VKRSCLWECAKLHSVPYDTYLMITHNVQLSTYNQDVQTVALSPVCFPSVYRRQSEATLNLRDDSRCSEKCKAKPMEVAFVVDASSSIWPQNFTLGLNFIEDFLGLFDIGDEKVIRGSIRVIGGFSPGDQGSIRVIGGSHRVIGSSLRVISGSLRVRVSLVTYGEVVYTQDAFNFGDYTNKGQLLKAITEIPYRSGLRTNTSGGIWYMLREQMPQARPDVRRVAIVLTDGNSQEADLTKQAALDAHVFVVDNYHMLQSIEDRLAYEACDECQNDLVDLAFVIDSSVSIGEADFEVGMEFIRQFVDAFHISPDAVRVAAIAFGERYFEEDAFNFDTLNDVICTATLKRVRMTCWYDVISEYDNKNDVMSALQNIPWRQRSATNTSEGLRYMRQYLMPAARPNAAHVCITLTDGQSQQPERTKAEAENARADHIVTFAVGVGRIGEELDEMELNNIAGDPSRVLRADTYAQLNLLKKKLTDLACTGKCEANPMDVAFVVDASASIWPANFTIGLNFIEDFVQLFKISDTAVHVSLVHVCHMPYMSIQVRVSLVTFGEVVYTQDAFNFGDHTNKGQLKQAISDITYRSGIRTNTSGGIWYMLNEQMPQARQGVRRVSIVLTDGNSQESDLTKQAAMEAHQTGLEMFAIGVGHDVSDQELHNIASDE
ncbi:hypothetical protein BaRGS_00034409, partial [Batillaria attramentaria]